MNDNVVEVHLKDADKWTKDDIVYFVNKLEDEIKDIIIIATDEDGALMVMHNAGPSAIEWVGALEYAKLHVMTGMDIGDFDGD